MAGLRLQLASIRKIGARLIENRQFAASTAKMMIARVAHQVHMPAPDRAGKIGQVSIRITDHCNLRCHTCGQWGDNGYLHNVPIKELSAREIPTERYIELLTDLHKHGHRPGLYLWGGEPMLYKGSVDLFEAAAKLGMPGSIATNGSRVAENAERLVEAPLFLLQASIDGPTAEVHNACRPGAGLRSDNFAVVNRGLDEIRRVREERGRKLPIVAALCTINNLNYDRLVETYDNFRDKVDMFVFYLAWWIDDESADQHTEDFKHRFGFEPTLHKGWVGGWLPPDFKVLSDQLNEVAKRGLKGSEPAVFIVPPFTEPADLERYYTDHSSLFGFKKCVSIYRMVEIDSNGDMSPCRDYHDYVVGNVKDHTITELWNNAMYSKFRGSLKTDGLMPVCTRCCGLMGN